MQFMKSEPRKRYVRVYRRVFMNPNAIALTPAMRRADAERFAPPKCERARDVQRSGLRFSALMATAEAGGAMLASERPHAHTWSALWRCCYATTRRVFV
eukprot:Transcript_24033.p3 GENE.Transcript_24033~~Transcript_24033.p3  ORF type:complete len:99 (+),score=9.17 Transcript_24033:367-663(+)